MPFVGCAHSVRVSFMNENLQYKTLNRISNGLSVNLSCEEIITLARIVDQEYQNVIGPDDFPSAAELGCQATNLYLAFWSLSHLLENK